MAYVAFILYTWMSFLFSSCFLAIILETRFPDKSFDIWVSKLKHLQRYQLENKLIFILKDESWEEK